MKRNKCKQAYQRSTPDDVNVIARDFTLEYTEQDMSRWNGNNIVNSHIWNAMSLMLPMFEHFTIRAARNHISSVSDPRIKKDAEAFCIQEKKHAKVHILLNKFIISRYPGVETISKVERRVLSFLIEKLPKKLYLAMHVGFEHLVSHISHNGLETPDRWFRGSDHAIFSLFEWHAMEEVEHKGVLFDIYQDVYHNYGTRISGLFLVIVVYLIPGLTARFLYLMYKDSGLTSLTTYRDLSKLLFGKNRISKGLNAAIVKYFKKDYNPWSLDSRPLLFEWYERHPPHIEISGTK